MLLEFWMMRCNGNDDGVTLTLGLSLARERETEGLEDRGGA
jgi:hypothetical protein